MTRPEQGDLAVSLAGHDAGRLYVVLATDGRSAWLSDGKHRKLRCPKRKNLRHIERLAPSGLEPEGAADRSLRTAIAKFKAQEGIRLGKR